MTGAMRDVFICHAREDKRTVVNPLVKALAGAQITYWLDEVEIQWGDHIVERVNKGLSASRYVIVVLSPAFISKNWPQMELNSMLNIEASMGEIKVLPLLVGAPEEQERILQSFPLLTGKLYLIWKGDTGEIVDQLRARLSINPGRLPDQGSAGRQLVTKPGFRYLLDRYLPSVHAWLTIRTGLFKLPPEWRVLHDYLAMLGSTIDNDIREKTYVGPPAKALPEDANRLQVRRTEFLTPIQQEIKEIVGISYGGDAQNAQISAISRKSKFVHNIVKRLLKADEPLILLGDPGTGKSITLQQATMLIARQESRRVFPKVCLFIRLGEFQLSPDETVWDYVKKVAPSQVRPYIEDLAAAGRLVIFFDGMDEMSRERYNEYTTALSIFAEAGANTGDFKTLFSCRITDFTPKFQHNRLVLLPFGRPQIQLYLKRQIRFPIQVGGRTWSARQLARQLVQGDLPMQADNPFVLWLLCTYLKNTGDWPRSRVHLLEFYNRLNYERKTRDAAQKGDAMPDMNHAFLVWGRIAYEITRRNKGAAISLAGVENFLGPKALPAVLAGIQCGVLQKSLDLDTTLIRFDHHRLQEYFTAFYLHNNSKATKTFKWLDKLDAPRWQETLFNLVLMGGGQKALVALREAIKQGLAQLDALTATPTEESPSEIQSGFTRRRVKPSRTGRIKGASLIGDKTKEEKVAQKSLEAVREETLLADRVELAARLLQQTQNQPAGTLDQFSQIFREAVYWLADKGNPITKVKMLSASKIVPGMDVFRVAREALSSNISWVRQQALIITSVASGEVGGGALQEDVLHSFASGTFLKRLGGFVRIAAATKSKRLWAVLIMGLVLCLAQLLAAAGLVTAPRHLAVQLFTSEMAAIDRNFERNRDRLEKEARENNDEEELKRIAESDQQAAVNTQQFNAVAEAVRSTQDAWWFLLIGAITMLVTLLYTLKRSPGQQLLSMQGVGFIWFLLPFIMCALWRGYWEALVVVVIFFFPFILSLLSAVNWAQALLIHALTLIVFAKTLSLWTGPLREKRMLVEALWENGGFRAWGTKTLKYGGFTFLGSAYIFLMPWVAGNREAIWAFINRFGLFSVLPPAVNVTLSMISYIEVIGCASSLIVGLKNGDGNRARGLKLFKVWTSFCVLLCIATVLVWRLSMADWKAIGQFLTHFGLLSILPPAVNAALSTVIYAVLICGLISFRLRHKKGPKALRRRKFFIVWRACAAVFVIAVLVIWLLSLINWVALGQFFAAHFGLFSSLPAAVNAGFSIAICAEFIGILISLARRLKRNPESQQRSLILFKVWTSACVVLVFVTLLGWYLYLHPEYIPQGIAVVLMLAAAILFLIVLGFLMRGLVPMIFSRRWPAELSLEKQKQRFRDSAPEHQAFLLRRAMPEARSQTASELLGFLQDVENDVQEEPALSAYWSKRYEVEQILRQDKIG